MAFEAAAAAAAAPAARPCMTVSSALDLRLHTIPAAVPMLCFPPPPPPQPQPLPPPSGLPGRSLRSYVSFPKRGLVWAAAAALYLEIAFSRFLKTPKGNRVDRPRAQSVRWLAPSCRRVVRTCCRKKLDGARPRPSLPWG